MKQREKIPLTSQWLWVSSPALLQLAHSNGALIPPLWVHTPAFSASVCLPKKVFDASFFLSPSQFQIFCVWHLVGVPCAAAVSRPPIQNPSSLPQSVCYRKTFSGGLCVKQIIWTCIVGLLLPVRYILDFWGRSEQKYGSFTAQQSLGWSWGLGYLLLLLKSSKFLGNYWDKTWH